MEPYVNKDAQLTITTLAELRERMRLNSDLGDEFLNYLLQDTRRGKDIWYTKRADLKRWYERVVTANPELVTESPFSDWFNRTTIRKPGDNTIKLASIDELSSHDRDQLRDYQKGVEVGSRPRRAFFVGGPSTKMAAILLAMVESAQDEIEVNFIYDGGEQSNESASASYEHINHANALNAEHDNSGLSILCLAIARALGSAINPQDALAPDYRKVDLWPESLTARDFPIYMQNELHGRLQSIKTILGIENDHNKSRRASLISTQILSFIEDKTGARLRSEEWPLRAFFLYLSEKEHSASISEGERLRTRLCLNVTKADEATLSRHYADLTGIVSGDLIAENRCIRHGFDRVCRDIMKSVGAEVTTRVVLEKVYFENRDGKAYCRAIRLRNLVTGQLIFEPLDYLALSLGPTADFRFSPNRTSAQRPSWRHRSPVPHQTVATGFSGQILFRIQDPEIFNLMPHTGLKQTHFVEMGRSEDLLLVKLTSGGNIGSAQYCRNYAISALANMFRILTPRSGLEFLGVVCAIPGLRGVNGPNNGQLVRLADNFCLRFGEGGTGMSKMGSNAQTLLDQLGLDTGLPKDIRMPIDLYKHTIIDRRRRVYNWFVR